MRAERPQEDSGSYEYLTLDQVKERAEEASQQLLKISFAEALELLKRGELSGTDAEPELTLWQSLLQAR